MPRTKKSKTVIVPVRNDHEEHILFMAQRIEELLESAEVDDKLYTGLEANYEALSRQQRPNFWRAFAIGLAAGSIATVVSYLIATHAYKG